MLILFIFTLALWAAGFALLPRLRGCAHHGGTTEGRSLSIIIPARNEEKNLPRLLNSLRAQSAAIREVIVVDDHSEDRTAQIATEGGATVQPAAPLPDGWRGKPWACQQGATAAAGELLLFLDADTWFEPQGLSRLLAAYPGGAFSIAPYHVVGRFPENLSLFFNINMAVGTAPDGLFGPMLLVDRASYLRVGGHEAVRGLVLENHALAAKFRAFQVPVQSALGHGILSFRMYPGGVRELIDGWTKGFASGAGRTPRHVLLLSIAWMTGLMLGPTGWLVTGDATWGGVYLLCAGQVAWLGNRVGKFSLFSALLYPVPLVFFFFVFARSAMSSGKAVRWKGREICAD